MFKSAFGERKSVLIREVSLLQRFTLERFHCTCCDVKRGKPVQI